MKEITEKIAQEYPEKKYILFDTAVDYTLGDLSNVYSMSYKQMRVPSWPVFWQQG